MLAYRLGKVDVYDSVLDTMLNSPSGALGRYLKRKAALHVAASKSLAGVRTGRLKKSISFSHDRGRAFQKIVIVANTSYAYYHHEGTKRHFITAHPDRTLSFQFRGRRQEFRRVYHPGTSPNKFLTIPLRTIWR